MSFLCILLFVSTFSSTATSQTTYDPSWAASSSSPSVPGSHNEPFRRSPLSVVSVSTDMGSSFRTNIINTINGVGLATPGSLTSTHAETLPNNSWASADGITTGNIIFSFSSSKCIVGFSFWNQNAGGPTLGSQIQGVIIESSMDGITYTPIPGAPSSFNQVFTGKGSPPQVVSFAPVTVTFVRFTVTSNYGDPIHTAYAEILFNDCTVLAE